MAELICVLLGGPTHYMPVRGRLLPFEMHPHLGPCPLTLKRHEPMSIKNEPPGFWDAWERFDCGGRKMDGDKCIVPEWCEACERTGEKFTRINSRNAMSDGPCPQCQGSRVIWKGDCRVR